MFALLAAAVLQSAAPPAFLDSADRVTVWIEQPATAQAMTGARLKVGDEWVSVTAAEPRGLPWREGMNDNDPERMVIVGDLQEQLGDGGWSPGGVGSKMKKVGPQRWELTIKLAPGSYQYKAAQGGSWARNWGAGFEPGGGNISLVVPAGTPGVRFVVDLEKKVIADSINQPIEAKPPAPSEVEDRSPSASQLFNAYSLRLAKALSSAAVREAMTLSLPGSPARTVRPRGALDHPDFVYAKADLGAFYSKAGTWFKVWSPAAKQVWLRLDRLIPMKLGGSGVWYVYVGGDHHGKEYTFRFDHGSEITEGADINAFAANEPLTKSVVVDLDRTDPTAWPSTPPMKHAAKTDAVIYEIHVRDLTINENSGLPQNLRGTYLGLATPGTKVLGAPTGLDYMSWLGVTDVHLLPIQSFQFGGYSWGYGTTLFNVPEAQYSTNPKDPLSPIREVKQMVRNMHNAGLRVVLDVVYNHTWPPEGKDSAFEATVPHFYLRENERGQKLNESGVGNALADERMMARKFVRDSLRFWLEEYGVDGFRFDLLGMHMPESVKDWAETIRSVRPDAVIYGEPWTGGGPTYFPKGAQKGLGVAVFNDDFRTLWRGDTDGDVGGLLHGKQVQRPMAMESHSPVISALSGTPTRLGGWAQDPTETINYVSAHDNLSLLDKIWRVHPLGSDPEKQPMVRLGTAAVLLSAGVPFLEGGAEMGRTKGGNHNSYDAGDQVNQYDWRRGRIPYFQETAEYTKGLIEIRRAHPALRMATAEQVEKHVKVWTGLMEDGVYLLEIDGEAVGDSWSEIYLYFNTGSKPAKIRLGGYNLASDGVKAVNGALRVLQNEETLPPGTAWVIWR